MKFRISLFSILLLLYFSVTAQAGWILYDDFSGSEVSDSKWTLTGETTLSIEAGKAKVVYRTSSDTPRVTMEASGIPSNAVAMRADISVLSGSGKVKTRFKMVLEPYNTDDVCNAHVAITPPSYSPLVNFSTDYDVVKSGETVDTVETFDGRMEESAFSQALGEEHTYYIGYDDETNTLLGGVQGYGQMSFEPDGDPSATTACTWLIQMKGYPDDYPDGAMTVTVDNVYYYVRDSNKTTLPIINLLMLSS